MRGSRRELYLFLDNEKQAMICSLFKYYKDRVFFIA